MPADTADNVTDDAILNGRLRLLQPRRGHRFGHDAILLAAAIAAQPGEHLVEFGAGVGAASLALLVRISGIDVTLVEIDPGLAALATENLARNGFTSRARAVTADVGALGDGNVIEPASADHVFMNPPFNTDSHQPAPDSGRRNAHHGAADVLPRWLGAARMLLKPSGYITVIWRADGLDALLETLRPAFGSISVRPVYPGPGRTAIRVIVSARLGGKAALRLAPPLVLNDAAQKPSPAAEAILRAGEGWPDDLDG